MGVVHEGFDPGLDRAVALKILQPALAGDPQFRERFLREARAMARVAHKNVAQVHFTGEEGGVPFFAMELIAGESALDRVRRGPLAVEAALETILQAAAGLQAAHDCGLIHRDVKPANLMIRNDGTVKVLDFGLARVVSDRHITAADVIMGSPDYMAPEVCRGEEPDHRSDIYGLGASLYHLLAGRTPFEGDTPLAILHKSINETCPRLDTLRAGLSEELCRAVERMMAKNPDDRPQGYAQVLFELARVGDSPEVRLMRQWEENSPHHRAASLTCELVLQPSRAFTRVIMDRPSVETESFLGRQASFGVLLFQLTAPPRWWGPGYMLLCLAFLAGLPLLTMLVDRVACRALRWRATSAELLAAEIYAGACLLPFCLMTRPTLFWLMPLALVLYLRTRTAGLRFVLGVGAGRASGIAVLTTLLATVPAALLMVALHGLASALGLIR